jgi:hypothetical protein
LPESDETGVRLWEGGGRSAAMTPHSRLRGERFFVSLSEGVR